VMVHYSIQEDRTRFFNSLRSATTTLDLARTYIRYAGILYNDQIAFMEDLFHKTWSREGRSGKPTGLMSGGGAISRDFISANFPELKSHYFEEMEPSNLEWMEILPETVNQYRDESVPSPPSLRLMRRTRAAFRLCRASSKGASLFVFPHGYQFFQRDTGASLYDARSRMFSRDILNCPRLPVDRSVVIIQDACDGDNFAHFLFDWLPRIVYFIQAKVEALAKTLFVLGGTFGAFQQALLAQIILKYGVEPQNFVFPDSRVIFDISGPVYFFSDQTRSPLHPAHMAHPNTMQIIRETIGGITRDKAPHPKLFISRADARLRRISNEPALIAQLEPRGFQVVRLSEHDVSTQISLLRGAEIVVGAHGMGLTHAVAHDGGLSLVELFHPLICSDAYIWIAKALGFQHRSVFGKDTQDGAGSYEIDWDNLDGQLASLTPSSLTNGPTW